MTTVNVCRGTLMIIELFFLRFECPQNTAYPGEVFELGLEALDEINQRTAAVIRISDSDDQAILPQPINICPLKICLAYAGGIRL